MPEEKENKSPDIEPLGPSLRHEVDKALAPTKRPPGHVPPRPKSPEEQVEEHRSKNPISSAWVGPDENNWTLVSRW